jgi:glycosyltransferase involved in cell wall biosynthesis
VFIREAIASVVQQDYQLGAVEGLVIDDGSRDRTAKQLSAFADQVRIVLTALGVSDANAYKVVENAHEAATKIEAVGQHLYRFWLRASRLATVLSGL